MEGSNDQQKREMFDRLFPLFRKMVDACPNSHLNDPLFYAKGIPIKIFRQTCSACAILKRVNVPLSPGETMGDPDSILLLARSILESYLTFYRIFVWPKTTDERDFWYYAWLLKSLVERADMLYPGSEDHPTIQIDHATGKKVVKPAKEVHANMLRGVEEVRQKILENPFYKTNVLLPDVKVQDRFKGYSRDGWKISFKSILVDANMKYFVSRDIYGFFSNSVHVDHISMRQLLLTETRDEQVQMSETPLFVILTVIARLCIEMPIVFPNLKPLIETDEKALVFALTCKKVSEITDKSEL